MTLAPEASLPGPTWPRTGCGSVPSAAGGAQGPRSHGPPPSAVLISPRGPLLHQLPHDQDDAVAAQCGRGAGVQRLRPLHEAARGERGRGGHGCCRGAGGREGRGVPPTWPPATARASAVTASAVTVCPPIPGSAWDGGLGPLGWCLHPYSSGGFGPGPAPAPPAWRKGPRQGQLLPRWGSEDPLGSLSGSAGPHEGPWPCEGPGDGQGRD